MSRKTLITVVTFVKDLESSEVVCSKLGISRGATITHIVEKFRADHNVIVNLFKAILEDKSVKINPSDLKRSTSMMLEADILDELEAIAAKLAMTRNGLVALIIRGIAIGAV